MVAGEPLRRVGAPTPRLLRSPPLAKVQSHSHHLLRQVLFAYLAVPPCLVELVVIAILHHSLLHCVVHNPCHPIPRLSVGKFELGVIPGSRRRRPRRFGRRRGGGGRARRCALGAPAGARRASAQCAQPVLVHHLGRRGWGSTSLGCGLAVFLLPLARLWRVAAEVLHVVNLSGLPPFPYPDPRPPLGRLVGPGLLRLLVLRVCLRCCGRSGSGGRRCHGRCRGESGGRLRLRSVLRGPLPGLILFERTTSKFLFCLLALCGRSAERGRAARREPWRRARIRRDTAGDTVSLYGEIRQDTAKKDT